LLADDRSEDCVDTWLVPSVSRARRPSTSAASACTGRS